MPTSTTIETYVLNSPGLDSQKEDPAAVRQHPASGLAARANGGAEDTGTTRKGDAT